MRLAHAWAMPNKWTFAILPIKELVERHVGDGNGWADPFAGCSRYAQYRNDLCPDREQPGGVEAHAFAVGLPPLLEGVLFDPPYSLEQISRSYKEYGHAQWQKDFGNSTGSFPRLKDLLAPRIRIGGKVLSFGWNTNGFGKRRGFDIEEILVVAHGGHHNDTLCTVEVKSRFSALDF